MTYLPKYKFELPLLITYIIKVYYSDTQKRVDNSDKSENKKNKNNNAKYSKSKVNTEKKKKKEKNNSIEKESVVERELKVFSNVYYVSILTLFLK
jgi:hypothetical protein